MKRKSFPAKPFAPAPPRIIVEWHLGHWTAWFENSPQVAFGGDTPGTAVDRLHENWQNERFTKAANRVQREEQ